MNTAKGALCLSICLLAGLVKAEVFMEEAAVISGIGPTRAGFSMRYAGACGERVGARVSYAGRAPIDDALPEVLQYARDSARHIVARCPKVQTIEVNAQGRQLKSNYLFVMHRADNWAPTDLALTSALIDALIDAGYLPGSGPQVHTIPAFITYQNDRFDVIYGRYLERRMTATYVERVLQEGAEPPRLSHYIVRGHWYELGHQKPGGQCAQGREGYPLWGSFTMTVDPHNNHMNTQRKRCVDHDDDAKAEPGYFFELSSSASRKYDIETQKISKVLGERFEASARFAETMDMEEFSRTRQPLYESDHLRLYAKRPDICAHGNYDAMYRVNSESRDSEFGGNYHLTIGQILRRVANEYCDNPLTASVDNFSQGDSQRWDRMSFQFLPSQASAFGGDASYLEFLDHSQGAAARAHDAWLAANLLGPACTEGPFCALPGGRYLNAIYRGDLGEIRQMDHLYEESVRSAVGNDNDPLSQLLFNRILDADDIQLLQLAANKYLFTYSAWGETCLDPGAQAKTFQYTAPLIIETDDFGATTRSGGENYEATYTLNLEFFSLRDRIGSAFGANESDDPRNFQAERQVFLGMVEMKRTYDCRSSEVKQFERQLLAVTNQVSAEPGTFPPTQANQPPRAENFLSSPFPPVSAGAASEPIQIARSAPVALPRLVSPVNVVTQKPAGQRTTVTQPNVLPEASADTSSMTAPERQQKMAAEIQALQQQIRNELNETGQAFQQVVLTATTDEERTTGLIDYQTKTFEIQLRLQTEILKIQEKYR